MILKLLISLSLVAVALVFAANDAFAEIAIIANLKGSCKKLMLEEVQQLYLAKTRSCSSQVVKLVEPDSASAVRMEFLAKVIGKNATEYRAYWSVLIFTGRARPPHEVRGDTEVKAWVTYNEAAIGYIDASSVDNSVQVIGTIK